MDGGHTTRSGVESRLRNVAIKNHQVVEPGCLRSCGVEDGR